MTARLHLPHPHLAEVAVEAARDVFHHLRKAKPTYTDPAVIARWAEWLTPEEWEHEHDGRTDR